MWCVSCVIGLFDSLVLSWSVWWCTMKKWVRETETGTVRSVSCSLCGGWYKMVLGIDKTVVAWCVCMSVRDSDLQIAQSLLENRIVDKWPTATIILQSLALLWVTLDFKTFVWTWSALLLTWELLSRLVFVLVLVSCIVPCQTKHLSCLGGTRKVSLSWRCLVVCRFLCICITGASLLSMSFVSKKRKETASHQMRGQSIARLHALGTY